MAESVPMRRFECGTRDPALLCAMLDMIDTVHIGLFDGEYPYVVPMSFGYDLDAEGGKLLVYVHCAREGKKMRLWTANPHVALTFDAFYNHPDRVWRGRIHDYRCVMARGIIRKIDGRNGEAALYKRAFERTLMHYHRGLKQFDAQHCRWCDLYVIECDLRFVSGKMEYPVEKPEDVPFTDVYALPLEPNGEDTVDFDALFSKKYAYHAGREDADG